MSLKRQRRKLNTSSLKILAEKLNSFCNFLNDEYNINYGGCCYVAYCIAKLLSRDNIYFKLVVYEYYDLEEKFKDVSESHYHYAISLEDIIINECDCEDNDDLYRVDYIVKASEILSHYKKRSWNSNYDCSKNNFIYKSIKSFYEDFYESV